MSEVQEQDKAITHERATRIVAGAEGAAAGSAVGAGISLIAVLASSALGSVVPVVGTSVGAVIGAALASWIQSKRKQQKMEDHAAQLTPPNKALQPTGPRGRPAAELVRWACFQP